MAAQPEIDIAYANRFIFWRLEVFQKDMGVCLTADARGIHAYMPALVTCIAWLELFTGLFKGNLDLRKLPGPDPALNAIKDFCGSYLPSYSPDLISLLYKDYRHKIAHVGAPYVVAVHDGKRITWAIHDRRGPGRPALELVAYRGTITSVSPWPVSYDHRFEVCLSTLRDDLERAAALYQADLQRRPDLLDSFSAAVEPYFPR